MTLNTNATLPSTRPRTRAQSHLINTGVHAQRNQLPQGPLVPDIPSSTTRTVAPEATDLPGAGNLRPRQRAISFRTVPNTFGLYRVYPTTPLSIPDAGTVNAPVLPATALRPKPRRLRSVSEIIAPCPNISTFYFQHDHWVQSGSLQSRSSRNVFQREVLQRPDFRCEDVAWVDLDRLDIQLAESAKTRNPLCPESEGWKSVPLQVQIPPVHQTRATVANGHNPAPSYVTVHGLRVQKLTDIIYQAFTLNNTATFHYDVFENFWIPPGSTSAQALRTSGEMYSSPAMIDAHKEVQQLKIRDADCTLPRCVAGFMFASDGLQFGNFSNAKGWPIFAYFGNESKYERCKPFSSACYHIAHIPTVSKD